MSEALDLRQLRKAKGWSQVEAARRLRVSQPYLSLLESGARKVTPALSRRLLRALKLSPSHLPLPSSLEDLGAVTGDGLAGRLVALGYQPLAYLRPGARPENPAAVLLWALGAEDLEPRLVEALPWLLLHFADLDTTWLVREAKVRDLQNRIGFVVSLGKEVAARDAHHADRLAALTMLETTLDHSRLVREDTLCEAAQSARMRDALRQNRSPAAAHWNLLTGWKAEHLRYDP
jgi:transcriptional regulator with XRE-family HTH domain